VGGRRALGRRRQGDEARQVAHSPKRQARPSGQGGRQLCDGTGPCPRELF
jgi:hypothetical protein